MAERFIASSLNQGLYFGGPENSTGVRRYRTLYSATSLFPRIHPLWVPPHRTSLRLPVDRQIIEIAQTLPTKPPLPEPDYVCPTWIG